MAEEDDAMSAMIRVKVVVQPGGRVEFTAPELAARAGETVELLAPAPKPVQMPDGKTFLEWLDSLPPSTKTAEEWEQFEREFQEMRDEWDR